MSLIKEKLIDNVLYLLPEGQIDSTNAAEAETAINAARAAGGYDTVTVDADDLRYISSAGLRVLLRLRKNEPTLTVINASSEVYEILEMTGFTEMIPTQKAYRRISVTGCEVIGKGANGCVYRIDPDTVVKVYRNDDALPDIKRERELARRAFVLGIPTAIPYDVVRTEEGYGSVFELLNAKSLAKMITDDVSRLDECIRISVDLMKKIHATEVRPEDMPDMREVAIGWAEFVADYIPKEKAEKLKALMKAVPVQHTMLHGDYHVKNVMVQNGEVLLIDMDTLCQGHPIFELASVFNAYMGFSFFVKDRVEGFLGIPAYTAEIIWKKSLALYLGTDDEARCQEVEDKAKIVGFTRLIRRQIRRKALENEEGKAEVAAYIAELERLLETVETLEF